MNAQFDGTGAVQWIDAAVAPLAKMCREGVDALGDMIIAAFDKCMTAAVAKGGDLVGKAGDMARSSMAAVKNTAENFSAFSERSAPEKGQELARSQKIEVGVETPQIPAPAKEAVAGLKVNHEQQITQMAEASIDTLGKPIAIGAQTQQQGLAV